MNEYDDLEPCSIMARFIKTNHDGDPEYIEIYKSDMGRVIESAPTYEIKTDGWQFRDAKEMQQLIDFLDKMDLNAHTVNEWMKAQ